MIMPLLKSLKRESGTILIVTAVTILIWFWAAGETTGTERFSARISFTLPEPASWQINQRQDFISITLEGSRLALQQAEQLLRQGLSLPLQAAVGRQTVDMPDAIRMLGDLESTGVKIVAVEPTTLDVEVDQIVAVTSRVRPSLPGVQTVGEVTIEPAEVTVTMPSALRQRFAGDLQVEAFVDRNRLDRLTPGQRHTLQVPLRGPDGLTVFDGVNIEPSTAKLSFTVQSRMREHRLDSVRVQLAGPPEDNREYVVDLNETVLRDVTIIAESDLIRRIEADEVFVVAMLHLSNREKEQGIDRKPISYFLALVPDDHGGTRGVIVDARVAGSTNLPIVRFRVSRRPMQ